MREAAKFAITAAVGIASVIALGEAARYVSPVHAQIASEKPKSDPRIGAAIVNDGKITGTATAKDNHYYGPGPAPTYIYNGPGGTIGTATATGNWSFTNILKPNPPQTPPK